METNMSEPQITIIPKPDYISFEDIQNLLNKAHESNKEKGLVYATANQTVSRLKEKIGDGVCLVALCDGKLAGTATISFRNLRYWYHDGKVAILKLLGVSPEYKGMHLSSLLLTKWIDIAKENNVNVLVTDSAEHNTIVRNICLKRSFCKVDYCSYKGNNFYTVVYAKWLNDCPHSKFSCWLHFNLKRLVVKLKYKPGKVPRFCNHLRKND